MELLINSLYRNTATQFIEVNCKINKKYWYENIYMKEVGNIVTSVSAFGTFREEPGKKSLDRTAKSRP